MVDVKGSVAVVFLLTVFSWLSFATMKTMKLETEIARLSSSLESTRSGAREQQELLHAGVRGVEDSLRALKSDLAGVDRKFTKDIASVLKSHQDHSEEHNAHKTTVEERLATQESITEKLVSGADGVKSIARKTAEVLETLAAQQEAVKGLTDRMGSTSDVVTGLVSQVVAIKEQLHLHTATPHLPEKYIAHATAHTLLGNASASPPPPAVATPAMSPPSAHAGGMGEKAAAAEAEAHAVEAAVASSTASARMSAAAGNAGAAEVAPEEVHVAHVDTVEKEHDQRQAVSSAELSQETEVTGTEGVSHADEAQADGAGDADKDDAPEEIDTEHLEADDKNEEVDDETDEPPDEIDVDTEAKSTQGTEPGELSEGSDTEMEEAAADVSEQDLAAAEKEANEGQVGDATEPEHDDVRHQAASALEGAEHA